MHIRYLKQKEIDHEKWDAAVDQSVNGQSYAYSWYLNCVAENWDALVTDDYTYIMPLPWNAKWLGVKQIYQPIFVQQLGIFGKEKPSRAIVHSFLAAIPPKFKYVMTHLNEQNTIEKGTDFTINPRRNMLLDLSESHEILHAKFRKSLRQRIRKGEKELSFAINKIGPEELVGYYQKYLNHKIGLPDSTYQKVLKLMKTALSLKKGNIYSAHFADGSFATGIFFVESHNRMVQLFGPSVPAGKKVNAKHFLLDAIIGHFAESGRILDFEGSEIPPIAEFFRGFKPQEVYYHQIIKDDFPFWVKGLQKIRSLLKK
jgi:hypothetical protein